MRHFAARNGGRFLVDFPGIGLPTLLDMELTNIHHGSSQNILLGFQWNGAVDPVNTFAFGGNPVSRTRGAHSPTFRRDFSAAGSLAEVEAGDGTLYWLDVPGNRLWIKLRGDQPNSRAVPPIDYERAVYLCITA